MSLVEKKADHDRFGRASFSSRALQELQSYLDDVGGQDVLNVLVAGSGEGYDKKGAIIDSSLDEGEAYEFAEVLNKLGMNCVVDPEEDYKGHGDLTTRIYATRDEAFGIEKARELKNLEAGVERDDRRLGKWLGYSEKNIDVFVDEGREHAITPQLVQRYGTESELSEQGLEDVLAYNFEAFEDSPEGLLSAYEKAETRKNLISSIEIAYEVNLEDAIEQHLNLYRGISYV